MLAQNFKSASDLLITDKEHAALVTVLGMLERGELDVGFAMDELHREKSCGTVACLCGWAYTVSGGEAFTGVADYIAQRFSSWSELLPSHVKELFMFNKRLSQIRYSRVTPQEAARALRNFMTTGEARWKEVLGERYA